MACFVVTGNELLLIFFYFYYFRFASMLSYSGLYLGLDELGEDLYLNSFIGGAVELVAFGICFFTMKTGRKGLYIALQIIGGLALIGSGFVISYSRGF